MKPTEEQLERLMYLIELPAMMDDESERICRELSLRILRFGF